MTLTRIAIPTGVGKKGMDPNDVHVLKSMLRGFGVEKAHQKYGSIYKAMDVPVGYTGPRWGLIITTLKLTEHHQLILKDFGFHLIESKKDEYGHLPMMKPTVMKACTG